MKKNGFTLLETLVAVTILALAIGGPMYAASRSLVAAQNSSNQLTASHLAQEGIEFVRKLRDNQFLQLRGNPDVAFRTFKVDGSGGAVGVRTCTQSNPCSADVWSSKLSRCTGPCWMYVDNLGKYYGITTSGANQTMFTREIYVIEAISSDTSDVEVFSKVTWNFKGKNYTVEVADTLTPWQPAQ
jgi:prepilin-type N-terminal cleavage/methylation domain-containing protein